MSEEVPKRREFTRVSPPVEVDVCSYGGEVFSGPARDLSMCGVYVEGDCSFTLHTSCTVEIKIEDGGKASAAGRVVRVDLGGVAVEFTAVPLETLEHLRSLILHHASDPAKVEGELSSDLGLRPKNLSRQQR